MVKNSFLDVHNLLMEELERLNDIDVTSESFQLETQRADSMVNVAMAIAEGGNVVIKATKLQYDIGNVAGVSTYLLGDKNEAVK